MNAYSRRKMLTRVQRGNLTVTQDVTPAELDYGLSMPIYAVTFDRAIPTEKQLTNIKQKSGITHLQFKSCDLRNVKLSTLAGGSIVDLTISGSVLAPDTLDGVASLSKLRRLYIWDKGELTSTLIAEIGKLTELKTLELNADRIAASALYPIGNLSSLEVLTLQGADLSGDALSILKNLPDLREFYILHCHLNAASAAYIADLKSAQSVTFHVSDVNDAVIAKLPEQAKLKEINFEDDSITDKSVQFVSRFKSLTKLSLDTAGVTDRALAYLPSLPALSKLTLGKNITDRGLSQLKKCKSLKWLEINSNDNVTRAGLKQLRGSAVSEFTIYQCPKVVDGGESDVIMTFDTSGNLVKQRTSPIGDKHH